MAKKSYERTIDDLIGLSTKKGAFYEELLWLSNNQKFIDRINALPNKIYSEDIYNLVRSCKLANTKYKGLLFNAIKSFIQNESFREFSELEPVDAQGRIKPSFELIENNSNETIVINITLYPDTKISQVNKIIKANYCNIQKWQNKLKLKKVKPKSDVARDYKNFYVLSKAGVSQKAMLESLEKNKNIMEPNSLAKITSRIQKKIDAAFK